MTDDEFDDLLLEILDAMRRLIVQEAHERFADELVAQLDRHGEQSSPIGKARP